jgi:hypothetical protein
MMFEPWHSVMQVQRRLNTYYAIRRSSFFGTRRLCEWPEFARSILGTVALSVHEPLRAQVLASVQSRTFTYAWTRAAVSQHA